MGLEETIEKLPTGGSVKTLKVSQNSISCPAISAMMLTAISLCRLQGSLLGCLPI